MQTIYWLILFVVFLIVEIATLGLTTIWFAAGSLVAWILGILGFGLLAQIVGFLITSVILWNVTRPLAMKYFNTGREKTNAESLIGEYALVTEEINTLHAVGHVEIRGMEWSAKTDAPNGIISKNKVVVVEGIQGVKLIVREKEED